MNQEPKTIKEDEGKNPGAVSTTVHTENAPPAVVRYEDQNFVDTTKAVWNYSLLYDDDIITFQNGTNYQLYKKIRGKTRYGAGSRRISFHRLGTACHRGFRDRCLQPLDQGAALPECPVR